jgi:cytoskeletal protein RodZ
MHGDVAMKAAALAVPRPEYAAAAAAAPAPARTPATSSKVASSEVRLASARPAPQHGRNLLLILIAVMALIFAVGGVALWRYNRQLEQDRLATEQAQLQQQTPPTQPAEPKSAAPESTDGQSVVFNKRTTATAPAPKPAAGPVASKSTERAAEKPGTVSSPALGEISISSNPAGAAVMVDGWSDPKWTTPFVATKLTAGEHVLTFSKSGYISHTRRVVHLVGRNAQSHQPARGRRDPGGWQEQRQGDARKRAGGTGRAPRGAAPERLQGGGNHRARRRSADLQLHAFARPGEGRQRRLFA